MKPITPSGTRTRAISRPVGRRHASTVSPTGSGSAAISRRPAAMVSMRTSVSVRRSRKARGTPVARARSRSARLASRIAGVFSSAPLQYDEVVAVDAFFKPLVAEPRFDLARLGAADLAQLRRVEVPQPPRDLAAVGLVAPRPQLARREVAFHLDHAGGEQAL